VNEYVNGKYRWFCHLCLARAQQLGARTAQEVQAPLVTCEVVITESCYLLRNLSGASAAVIENIAAGIFQIPFQLSRETAGVKQVLRKYKHRKIDLADACLIRLADQFGTGDILTRICTGQTQSLGSTSHPGPHGRDDAASGGKPYPFWAGWGTQDEEFAIRKSWGSQLLHSSTERADRLIKRLS
jgi:predicted nucleic acid-binding protein